MNTNSQLELTGRIQIGGIVANSARIAAENTKKGPNSTANSQPELSGRIQIVNLNYPVEYK